MAATKKTAQASVFTKTIALQDLRAGDTINARRTGRDAGLDELKASILAHGIVQSLRVRLVGQSHYEVIAGNRRFLALQQLEAEGKIEPDYLVPVIVGVHDDAAAHELSVVENVERVPVSPIDEFKAFGRLIDEGRTAEDVAGRFGVPVRRVQQRMKLAGLHPDVLEALDAGRITIEGAQAFTLVEPATQAAKLKEWSERSSYTLRYAENIRSALVNQHVRADSAEAQIVGEEAYLAAGGQITTDLFGDRTFWVNRDIVDRLLDEHWQGQAEAWRADGWSWVMPATEVPDVWSRNRTRPTEQEPSADDAARSAELEEAIEKCWDEDGELLDEEKHKRLEAEFDVLLTRYLPAFTAENKAKSGVVYWRDGRVEFGVGEVRAGSNAATGTGEKKAPTPEDPAAVGPTVSQTLSAVLSDAIRTEVAADINLALPLLAAFMAAGQAGRPLPGHLSFGHATQATPHDSKVELLESFRYFSEMGAADLSAAIAHMFANTLDVKDSFLDPKYRYTSLGESGRRKLVTELVEIVDPRQFPEFDAAAYFAAVKKPLITAAFQEITGATLKDGKKADMAATVAKLAVEHGWLPVVLRGPSYEGPGSGAAAEMQEAAE